MIFKKWLMRKYNLVPAEQIEEIQMKFEKEIRKYRELIKEMSPQINVNKINCTPLTLKAQYITTKMDKELLGDEYMNFVKAKLSEEMADYLNEKNLLKITVDEDYFKDTTGSILVEGTLKVYKDEDSN